MCKWNAVCRRVVAVVLLFVGLLVVPSVSAFADGDVGESRGQAQEDEAGLIDQAVNWLVELFTGNSGAESDNGSHVDPSG